MSSDVFGVEPKKHSLPEITFHQLRHTNASLLIAEGVDVKTVSNRLGHSKASTTTDIYTHALKRPDREAAEKLDALFNKDIKRAKTTSKE